MKISLKKAGPEEAEAVAGLINSAYRGDSARAGWTYESDLVDGLRITAAEVREITRRADEFFLLVLESGSIIGGAHVREREDAWFIGMLTVRPDRQNAGIGGRLLTELETRARLAGKRSTRLDVIHVRSELIAYYERKGYRQTGLSEPFPSQYPAKVPGLRLIELKKTL